MLWTVSARTSAPAPPVSAAVASEHNVAFVSIRLNELVTKKNLKSCLFKVANGKREWRI